MSTTIGPDKGGGHFEVIRGQIMRIFQVCRILTKLGGWRLHLVPTEVEVVLRSVDAIFKFPALWPYINDAPDRGDIMFAQQMHV